MDLVPVAVQASSFDFKGDLATVQKAVQAAKDLMDAGKIQDARQLVSGLASEIRVNVIYLPLGTYPAVIEKTAAMIVGGKIDEAKKSLTDVLDTLASVDEVYPLPILTAETPLTEAYEVEYKADLSKAESRKTIEKLVDQSVEQIKIAETLGYGGKDDYKDLYQGIDALKQTIHTKSFASEWDKLKKHLSDFKNRIVHPAG